MSFVNALERYIKDPEAHKKTVLFCDQQIVVIKDAFPKALRHYLIIPRDEEISHQSPVKLLHERPEVVDMIQRYAEKTKEILVQDLFHRTNFLKFYETDPLAKQEFKNRFIKVGVHSVPSLGNLHVHVITRDFFSPRMKNKKHYNSFNSNFFIDLLAFDSIGDSSEHSTDYELENLTSQSGFKDSSFLSRSPSESTEIIRTTPLKCALCGTNFGNQFAKLKRHLAQEFLSHFKVNESDLGNVVPNG